MILYFILHFIQINSSFFENKDPKTESPKNTPVKSPKNSIKSPNSTTKSPGSGKNSHRIVHVADTTKKIQESQKININSSEKKAKGSKYDPSKDDYHAINDATWDENEPYFYI